MISDLFVAYNPAIVTFPSTQDEIIVTITISNYDNLSVMGEVEKKKEIFNNNVRIDVSNIVSKFFNDIRIYFNNNRFFTSQLFVLRWQLLLEPDTNIFIKNIGIMLNAVVQVGENPDLTLQRGTFRTHFKRLKKYNGYELTVGVLSYSGVNNFINNVQVIDDNGLLPPHFCVVVNDNDTMLVLNNSPLSPDLTGNTGEIITDNLGNIIQVNIPTDHYSEVRKYVDLCCTPSNPFYVRWVNQLGGYDYFMFGKRQTHEYKTDKQEYYKPFFNDVQAITGTTRMFYMEAAENITAGAEQVTNDDYEALHKIIYSPLIEWYNEKLNKWIEVLVDDFDITKDTWNNTQSVEVTFNLPDKQLQV
ncbi:MAG: hypothetical protein FWD66_01075 [Paludibacter sp.]|nr:hypothetical protein [Paludibacter sp.]